MAIEVQTRCSDCGTITDRSLTAGDSEIICPECRRNMPNLSKDEFREVSRAQNTQNMMGIVSLLCAIGMGVALYFYLGDPKSWISTEGAKATDTSQWLFGAIGLMVLAAVFGALSARKRYVIEF